MNLPDGVQVVMPGDNITMTIELDAPIALDEQLRFAIFEADDADADDADNDDDDSDDNRQLVGVGVVTKILA